VQHSVRDFVDAAAAELKIAIEWKGGGVDETGTVTAAEDESLIGKTIVRVNPRYFRPTEVETLLGDCAMAKEELGWEPETTFAELVAEMVRYDLNEAQRDQLCLKEGFDIKKRYE